MIAYDVMMKVLDTVISSAQHCWPDLRHYIVLFESGEASTVAGNKHTHTHTHRNQFLSINLLSVGKSTKQS